MKKTYVADLLSGPDYTEVCDYFVTADIQQKITKNSQPYLDLRLVDKTGSINARVWSAAIDAVLPALTDGQLARITGIRQSYQGMPQVVISCAAAPDEELDIADFVRVAPIPFDRLQQRFWQHVESIGDPFCHAILAALVGTPQQLTGLGRLYFDISAGPGNYHHDYLHGLLQHVVEVADYIDLEAQHHPQAFERDIALTGGLLHDIGKVKSYTQVGLGSWKKNAYGHLVDHLAGGAMMLLAALDAVDSAAGTVEGVLEEPIPDALRLNLQHILLSHHHHREWGAVVPPQTPEAWAVAMADQISATLAQVSDAAAKETDDEGWTGKNFLLDNTRMYLPQKAVQQESVLDADTVEAAEAEAIDQAFEKMDVAVRVLQPKLAQLF